MIVYETTSSAQLISNSFEKKINENIFKKYFITKCFVNLRVEEVGCRNYLSLRCQLNAFSLNRERA
jgi:hypothetical protein